MQSNLPQGYDPVNPGSPQPGPGPTGWRRFVHLHWLRRPVGMLKIAEFVIVFLAVCIMGSVGNVAGSGVPSINFFNFVYPTVLINLIVRFILFTLHWYHRVWHYMTCNFTMSIMLAIITFLMLISSSVVIGKWPGNSTIKAGGAFGLIACGLFAIETFFYVQKLRENGKFATDGVTAITGEAGDAPPTAQSANVI